MLNLNGTLVYRTNERPGPKKFDFKHKRSMCYFRPGYMDFVRALKKHPRVELGFYSSLMSHNLIPVIMALFPSN